MREIPLTRGYVALVDDEDYDALIDGPKWSVMTPDGHPYAVRNAQAVGGGRSRSELMHRVILPGAFRVDHINGDGLDNRRGNLRRASQSENGRNRRGPNRGNTSGFLGVSWNRERQRWVAQITVHGRNRNLGRYDDPTEAARARDRAASELHGEFARLNFPQLGEERE